MPLGLLCTWIRKESIITGKTVPSDATIKTAGKKITKARTEEESVVNLTGRTEPSGLNNVVPDPNVEYSLISVSSCVMMVTPWRSAKRTAP